MAKRKPPSQRAERAMDETAKAIAEARLAAKPEKPADGEKEEHGKSFSHASRNQGAKAARPSASPAPSAMTKRNKSGGG